MSAFENGEPFVAASEESEACLLGAVLLVAAENGPDAAEPYLKQLSPSLFNDERHKRILDALNVARKKPGGICEANVDRLLRSDGRTQTLAPYAISLPAKVHSRYNWESWLDEVMKAARARETHFDLETLREAYREGKLSDSELARLHRAAADHLEHNGAAAREPLIRAFCPSEIIARPAPEGLLLVGDYQVTRSAMTVIGGPPGVGKSVALHELAFSGATGRPWFGLQVHRRFKTFILQNENGTLRLKREFAGRAVNGADDFIRVTEPPECGLAFGREDFRADLRRMLADFQPDVFALDPFSNVAFGDKKADYEDAFASILECLPKGDLAPAIVVVAHTRKPQGDERKSGRSLLHLLAGSYVLTSRPRAAFIMQPACDDTEDRRVVWTCCKNNDGSMGARGCWERNGQGFVMVPDFDWDTFDGREGGGRPAKVAWEDVAEVLGTRTLSKSRLVDALRQRCDCGPSACYRALERSSDKLTEDRNGMISLARPISRNPYHD
jgi:hypothetical protein